MSTIEDRVLVWRFNRGDPAALCRIYEKHRDGLLKVAAALLNDRSGVEDVLHDVFVAFAQTTARFFRIPASEQAAWQSLRDQGIELIQAAPAPETCYATLSGEQSERFEEALAAKPVTSPRVLVGEGGEAMIASGIFALAWRPTLSSEGTQIASSFSFHDGETGFEIPNISVAEGEVILVRVRGITPAGEDVLILLTIAVPQAP